MFIPVVVGSSCFVCSQFCELFFYKEQANSWGKSVCLFVCLVNSEKNKYQNKTLSLLSCLLLLAQSERLRKGKTRGLQLHGEDIGWISRDVAVRSRVHTSLAGRGRTSQSRTRTDRRGMIFLCSEGYWKQGPSWKAILCRRRLVHNILFLVHLTQWSFFSLEDKACESLHFCSNCKEIAGNLTRLLMMHDDAQGVGDTELPWNHAHCYCYGSSKDV